MTHEMHRGGESDLCMHAQLRRLKVLQHHLKSQQTVQEVLLRAPCRATASHSDSKVAKAAEAVALIPDSAIITASRMIRACFPDLIERALPRSELASAGSAGECCLFCLLCALFVLVPMQI